MKNLLFICTRQRYLSATAEQVFATRKGVETDSAGLAPDAATPLSVAQLDWATHVFVMEKGHKTQLLKRFPAQVTDRRIVVLGIPDDYDYMDPELMRLLEEKVGPHVRRGEDA